MAIELEMMTFNLRYGDARDGFNSWERRRPSVAKLLREYHPDILGCQEATPHQRAYLQAELGADYACLGVGREADGTGEQSLLLYRSDRLQLLEWQTVWLSERPELPGSRGWDASLPRTTTLARLQHAEGTLLVLNAHLDHRGTRARAKSVELLQRILRERQQDGEGQVLLGDFNAQEKAEPIRSLRKEMQDAYRQTFPDARPREAATFHAFFGPLFPFSWRVDYIFVDPAARVEEAEILKRRGEHGGYLSDHYPVRARVRW